jgi:hypothetical protein
MDKLNSSENRTTSKTLDDRDGSISPSARLLEQIKDFRVKLASERHRRWFQAGVR